MSPVQMNFDWIRQLCALSVLCGLALSLTPEGGVKKIFTLCCAVLMLTSVLNGVRETDYSVYAVELQRYRELGRTVADRAKEGESRLNRLVIERECEEYVMNTATSLGMSGLEVEVTARWHVDGFWVPDSVRLRGRVGEKERERLSACIAAELGIGPEKQEWSVVDGE